MFNRCVEGIHVDISTRTAVVGKFTIAEGDLITIDGATGDVYIGEVDTIEASFSTELEVLLKWADERARLVVMANADTPNAAKQALEYGAMGIGLCRTERMFNAKDRLPIVIDMIVAETTEKREAALEQLLPIQRDDFKAILKIMTPKPVTIRLLDPPIHEFLPSEQQLVDELEQLHQLKATVQGMNVLTDAVEQMYRDQGEQKRVRYLADSHMVDEVIQKKTTILKMVRNLFETNPMLGHRGCRLSITYPEICKMQARAIMEAACNMTKKGIKVLPEIMIPLIGTKAEFDILAEKNKVS